MFLYQYHVVLTAGAEFCNDNPLPNWTRSCTLGASDIGRVYARSEKKSVTCYIEITEKKSCRERVVRWAWLVTWLTPAPAAPPHPSPSCHRCQAQCLGCHQFEERFPRGGHSTAAVAMLHH
ncbi:hypothetical protein ElyMa_005046700 [Elysia marginata]|uniref:Uncharacterized protein n=1 Tax=Elysia marginata TaxID=1093978 RepID=A0AAV4JE14_9GAST|nr:hypothetical protein ElyMa_005046700 [Elysia marginata]